MSSKSFSMPSPSILPGSAWSANWANQAGSASSNGSSLGFFFLSFFCPLGADSAGVEVEPKRGLRVAAVALDLVEDEASGRRWGVERKDKGQLARDGGWRQASSQAG